MSTAFLPTRRSTSRALQACALAAVCGLVTHSATAQVARYQPRTPTVSPYLNLTLNNFSALPNYFALVRPQIQQRNLNLQEQRLLREQGREISRLEGTLQQSTMAAPGTGSSSWFLTPGQAFRYRDTRQFFPEPPRPYSRRP